MPRDMIPLRPIEGATELPMTVSDWLAIRQRSLRLAAQPLPPTGGQQEFVDTFLTVPSCLNPELRAVA